MTKNICGKYKVKRSFTLIAETYSEDFRIKKSMGIIRPSFGYVPTLTVNPCKVAAQVTQGMKYDIRSITATWTMPMSENAVFQILPNLVKLSSVEIIEIEAESQGTGTSSGKDNHEGMIQRYDGEWVWL